VLILTTCVAWLIWTWVGCIDCKIQVQNSYLPFIATYHRILVSIHWISTVLLSNAVVGRSLSELPVYELLVGDGRHSCPLVEKSLFQLSRETSETTVFGEKMIIFGEWNHKNQE